MCHLVKNLREKGITKSLMILGQLLQEILKEEHKNLTGKESACNVGDLGSIPGWGRSSGAGKGYPLQYSGLENSMDCIVHGVAKSWDTTERLSLLQVLCYQSFQYKCQLLRLIFSLIQILKFDASPFEWTYQNFTTLMYGP